MSVSSVAARIVGSALLCALLTGCRNNASYNPSYLAFIDKSGRVRIRLQPTQEATSFSEGLAAVSRHGRWGYINTSGAWVIPPRFVNEEEFSEGLAVVMTGEYWSKTTKFGFIDKTGKFVIAPRFDLASSFSEGVAPVCTGPCRIPDLARCGPSYGYINRAGDYVMETKWDYVGQFSESRAWVDEMPALVGGKIVDYQQPTFRLIDREGKLVSDAHFRLGMRFSYGLAVTDRGYVNRAGEVVIPERLLSESFAEAGPPPPWAGEPPSLIRLARSFCDPIASTPTRSRKGLRRRARMIANMRTVGATSIKLASLSSLRNSTTV